MARTSNGVGTWLVLCALNLTAFGGMMGQMYYLKSHRPPAPDPTHGFIVRQSDHNGHAWYVSRDDQWLGYGLIGMDIVVYAGSTVFAYAYAKSRKRQP